MGRRSVSSITDLPMPIFVDILLRLSVKAIFICKCVSKTWLSLISDPQFAKLQFAQAKPCPLLQASNASLVSRTLYLVEPETCHDFDLGYCSCNDGCEYVHCGLHVNMKLDTKLKIPFRNPQMVLSGDVGDAQMGCSSKGSGIKRKRCIRVKPKEQKFKIVNSCNGFLCLSEPSRNHPVLVCNPITDEYINLPVGNRAEEKAKYFGDCGFGFSPKTNQYKVIRMFRKCISDPIRKAEVHTLGTGSWKSIGDAPISDYTLPFPTYLKGVLHWFCHNMDTSNYIATFNFDYERFHSVPLPPRNCDNRVGLSMMCDVSMGVLEGCLCVCDASKYNSIHIWVMKEYGVQESWTRVFSVDTLPNSMWSHCLYQPIDYLKDGAVLLFNYSRGALICYYPEGPKFKYLKIHGIKSQFEAISYIPSFISLKDAVVGDNVVVLNIDSRCAEFKVQGEFKDLLLVEEDGKTLTNSECSYYSSDTSEKWLKHWNDFVIG